MTGRTLAATAGQGGLRKILAYALAAAGPIACAGAHFLLSLAMLRLLSGRAFGSFTFLLVISQFSWGLWSALFCAPLPTFLALDPVERDRRRRMIFAASLIGVGLSLLLFAGFAVMLGLSAGAAACFAAYGALALIRWLGRADAYVDGRPLRTTASDLIYSTVLLLVLAIAVPGLKFDAQSGCYLAMLAGSVAGLLPFGRAFFRSQLAALGHGAIRGYGAIWRDQSRWALIGVVTTEATANAHVYLVTIWLGPLAFAPLAASALILRPVNVAQNALADFERPQIARLIAAGRFHDLGRSLRDFRLALAAIWLGTVALSVAIFATRPDLIFPAAYDMRFLQAAVALWTLFAAFRLLQTPESTLLQSAGAFRPLAMASLWSSLVSVAMVAICLALWGSLMSLAGLVLGAAVYCQLTHRQARRWRASVPAVA